MVIGIYVAMNVLYSYKLKQLVLIDVLIIAFGFILRVYAGAYAIEVPVSSFIFMATLFLSLFLGFTKRKGELIRSGSEGRAVLEKYSLKVIDQYIIISATLTIMCYALYTLEPSTIARFSTNRLIYSVIFVIYGMFRYVYILDKDEKLMRIMIYRLETGSAPKIQSNFWYNVASAAVSVQKIGGTINSFFYRPDMQKCVQCMRCVRECSENNIRFEKGKIRFGHRCDMCMRCSFFCPTDAIKIGFLQGWKVNGDYHLDEIAKDPLPQKPYIDQNSRGFFKCFVRSFSIIDKEYAALFPEAKKEFPFDAPTQ